MNETLWNRKFILLIVINTLSCFGFYMITTILASYLVDVGSSVEVAGWIVGMFSITSLVMRPITGYLSDLLNKKWILIYGCIVIGISIIGYVMTTTTAVIVIFRIAHGISFALISTAIVAMSSEYIPMSKFTQGIGYLGLGQIIASAVGPGIGTWIMNHFGIKNSFITAAMFSFIAVLVMLTFSYQQERKVIKFKIKLDEIICVKALNYASIGGMFSFCNGVIASFIVLYANTKDIKDISIYFTVCAIFMFIIRPIVGGIVDKIDMKYIVYPGILMTAVSMLILAHADSIGMILLSAVIRAIGQGAVQPLLQAQSIKTVGIEKSGVATSTYYLGGDIGQGIGPIVGGMIVGVFGYTEMFYLCAIILVVAMGLFYIGERGKKNVCKSKTKMERE